MAARKHGMGCGCEKCAAKPVGTAGAGADRKVMGAGAGPKGSAHTAGKNWIKGAVGNKGGLHRSLGIPEGQTIPARKIAAAASKPGKVGKQARLAQTLKSLH